MMFESMDKHPGARFLLSLASLVIVVAGLRAAAPILVPFALALFLAIVSTPVMFGLQKRNVPPPIAIAITVLGNVVVFGLLVLLAVNSVGDVSARLPRYRAQGQQLFATGIQWLDGKGLPASENISWELVDAPVFSFIGNTLQTVGSLFAVAFIVALITVFILAEATVFPFKFQAILGQSRKTRVRWIKTIQEVQVYLGIKTLISLATGLVAGLFCYFMKLDFPVVLGITAFALNYVPTVGSIIAAVPAMALALLLHGPAWALFVGLGYFAINTIFGNIIEPNLMGRRLGLSTLVVVLSLLFWGWVWGPIGALLSVPLTMVLKIALENTPDLRWAAVLLDKVPPQARKAARETPLVDSAATLPGPLDGDDPDLPAAPSAEPETTPAAS